MEKLIAKDTVIVQDVSILRLR
ncbi:hypothetical protein A2U01_0067165, partial [Trifolium medium]|nr:hypothetical protein [Trifolium medium]